MRQLERFSLNHATTKNWPLPQAVAGCVAAGVPGIGLWREEVAAFGLDRTAKLVRDAGLRVTSLCRGGFFGADGWFDDNRHAIDEAATLSAPVLVLVSGGLPAGGRDVDAARRRVADAIGTLVPHASAAGVMLAVEPLHPMFCADRCVVATLGQALDIAERFPPKAVGVVVDTYHIWWDPALFEQIARAAGRISIYQVCDWVVPLPEDMLLGRGHVGDGHIEFAPITDAVRAAGYDGWVEVEIFNQSIWDTPPDQTVATVKSRWPLVGA